MMSVSKMKWAALAMFLATPAWSATVVTSIDFKVSGGESILEIRGTGPLSFEPQENPGDRQLVLDLKDTTLGPSASRRLDTSSFNSKVSLVSPYQVDARDGSPAARLVLQLREWVPPIVQQEGNLIRVRVPGEATGAEQARVPTQQQSPAPEQQLQADSGEPADPAAAPAPGSEQLDSFLNNRAAHRFTGKPVTLQVKDADLADVFRLVGEASGFNIVMSDDVKGKITLSLTDVPWDQALDLILRSQRLGAERNYNVLRIVTLENLTKEKRAELEAKAAAAASTPRITRIFPVNYASLAELVGLLQKFAASSTVAQTVSGATLNDPVLIEADQRTNSIVVRDTPQNVEKMKRLIELLDTQTPQILIEAKVVLADETFNKSMSGKLGLQMEQNGNFAASFMGGNTQSTPLISAGISTIGASDTSSAFLASPTIGFIPGVRRINAFLSMQESETRVKVISSPKLVVMNKETSTILQSTPVYIPAPTVSTTQTVTATVQEAKLSLKVQPTVTNDGAVLMELDISRDVPMELAGAPPDQRGVGQRNIQTKVLVDSGSTLVIGGIYTQEKRDGESGFPVLKDLPIIGALFRSSTSNTERNELFIFVTPRILNEKEAGLSG